MSPTGQPVSPEIGLPPEQFAAAFPFHFALDWNLKLLQVGSTLRRICPDLHPGADLTEIFRVIRPEGKKLTHQLILDNALRFFLLEHRASGLQLRGEFMLLSPPPEDILVFLGSPWFVDSAEVASYGLGFEDFAIHDPAMDMLQVFQSSKQALADAKKLADKLTRQRKELRATNERLLQQEAESRKLALIAARTDNAVVLTDAEGRTVWVNEGFTRITGYTLAEIKGKKPGSVLQGPGTDPETVRRIGERLRKGEGFSEEILNYGKGHRSYWLAIEVQPIRDESGQITNFMAIETDITVRRAAQQRLAIQFEVSRVLTEVDNLDAAVPQLLKTICENLGWHLGQFWRVDGESLHFVDFWHPAAARVAAFVSASRATEFARTSGLPGRVWSTGRPVWIPDVTRDANFPRNAVAEKEGLRGAFAFPVLVRGEIWGVAEFFSRNIEEPDETLLQTFAAVGNQVGQFIVRRQAEEALRETSTLQKAMLEGANYSIISTTRDGIIRMFNSAAERMLGYSSDQVVGKITPAIFHDLDEVTARAAELTRELGREVKPGFETFAAKPALGKPDEREWTYIRKDGSRLPVQLSVTALFDENRTVVGYLGIASDITESKRAASELLKAKEAAEAANRAKSEFLATMSHEIRTPMNAVIGMSELLLNTELSRRQRDFAEAVAASADGLLHVIDDILDFSKIEAGKLIVASEQFAVRSVIDSVLEVASHREPGKAVRLIAIVHHDVPFTLLGDPLRLRQILLNLVGNAVKFTERGEVLVRVRPLAVSSGSTQLRFEVSDTGVGLTEEQLGRLFQPFVQADSSSSRRFGGTGLGLAISRRLVELMGGTIGASSAHGEGSTFWFQISLAVPAQPDPLQSHPGLQRAQIIVGASHAGVRESLHEQFSRWGLKCTTATSADELTQILRSPIQSEQMPFMVCEAELLDQGGAALRKQLGAVRGKAHCLLLADASTAVPQEDALQGLFDGILFRPVKQSLLFDSLVTAVEGKDPATSREEKEADQLKHGERLRRARQFSGLSILVAEDHPINRKLCLLMLESLGGCADVATNGREVLAAVRQKPYDLILMDCNMPEMDGYQAATAVREWEATDGRTRRRRIHIVALTANAMIGERERCLAAGMDDYLTKPFTGAQLRQVLVNLVSDSKTRVSVDQGPGGQVDLDTARLSQLVRELDAMAVRQMVTDFVNELPQRLAELGRFIEAQNWEEGERVAHSLKGVSSSFGFERLSAVLRALEEATGGCDLETSRRLLPELEPLRKSATDGLEGWLGTGSMNHDPGI